MLRQVIRRERQTFCINFTVKSHARSFFYVRERLLPFRKVSIGDAFPCRSSDRIVASDKWARFQNGIQTRSRSIVLEIWERAGRQFRKALALAWLGDTHIICSTLAVPYLVAICSPEGGMQAKIGSKTSCACSGVATSSVLPPADHKRITHTHETQKRLITISGGRALSLGLGGEVLGI